MTKTNEIALLDKTIATFGTDSYLGPWLKEHRDTLVAQISNDWPAEAPMPSVARREAEQILADARETAQRIRDEATLAAHKLRESVQAEIQGYRNRARSAAQAIVDRI